MINGTSSDLKDPRGSSGCSMKTKNNHLEDSISFSFLEEHGNKDQKT